MRRHNQVVSDSAVMKGSSIHDNYNYQQQFGRNNHSRDSSGDDCTNFCEAKGPMSPTAWMCEVTGKKMSQLCRPFMSGNSNVQLGKEDTFYPKRPPRSDNSDASVASWRERAAKSILSVRNSDDEDSEEERGIESNRRKKQLAGSRNVGSYSEHYKAPIIEQSTTPAHTTGEVDSADDEPRIIAPNVDKISQISVVEVRLQSIRECVTILCSVDVLKMKSAFFYEVLNEQEENRKFSNHEQNQIWREPLLIPEISPFEAAAFIESLHEGRQVCKGEWNYCWARLRYVSQSISVSWQVQELIAEYALLIKAHFGKLLNCIQQNNWRTNPNILVGARVAVFRKSATLIPIVVTGVAVEAAASTSYSKLRVIFDSTDSKSIFQSNTVGNNGALCQSPMTGTRVPSPTRRSNVLNGNSSNLANRAHAPVGGNSASGTPSSAVYADISEPFWIQLSQQAISSPAQAVTNQPMTFNPALSQYSAPVTPHPNSEPDKQLGSILQMWCDPDEAFITEIKKYITIADKIVFWEMAKAIMELPRLSEYCDSAIRNSKDLAAILKRTEFKFLWSADAPDLLPKDAASELVSAAYVASY